MTQRWVEHTENLWGDVRSSAQSEWNFLVHLHGAPRIWRYCQVPTGIAGVFLQSTGGGSG